MPPRRDNRQWRAGVCRERRDLRAAGDGERETYQARRPIEGEAVADLNVDGRGADREAEVFAVDSDVRRRLGGE